MKKLFFTLFISTLFVNVYSQETMKKKTKNFEEKIVEVFYVDISEPNIKQGEYLRKDLNDKIFCKGQYKNNFKSGIWYYYDYDGNIEFKYDYDLKKYIEENNALSKMEISDKYDVPAILLMSSAELISKIIQNLQYPIVAADKGISGRVFIDILVEKNGKILGYKIKESVHELLDNEALRVVKLITKDIEIIPATKNGVNVDSELTIPIVFMLN